MCHNTLSLVLQTSPFKALGVSPLKCCWLCILPRLGTPQDGPVKVIAVVTFGFPTATKKPILGEVAENKWIMGDTLLQGASNRRTHRWFDRVCLVLKTCLLL